ncbi:MAG: zf-HC2 domain-containing protein [Elusimicrobiota bacterium]
MHPQQDPSLLSAYLDGELGPEEAGQVESHLQSCHACQQELSSLKAIQQAIQGVNNPAMPAELVAEIERHTLARQSWWRRLYQRLQKSFRGIVRAVKR